MKDIPRDFIFNNQGCHRRDPGPDGLADVVVFVFNDESGSTPNEESCNKIYARKHVLSEKSEYFAASMTYFFISQHRIQWKMGSELRRSHHCNEGGCPQEVKGKILLAKSSTGIKFFGRTNDIIKIVK
jgi:hypothetical protein